MSWFGRRLSEGITSSCMHIAIDVRSLIGLRHSGVEEYTIQIIRAMSVVAPQHTYHLFYSSFKKVEMPSFRENVVVHPFHYPNKLIHTSQWLFSRPRWDVMLPVAPDVVFVPNPHRIPLSYTVPLVSVVHDLAFERFPEFLTFRKKVSHRFMRNPKFLLKNSSQVIAVSDYTKEDVVELYEVDPSHISVVYSGISASRTSATPFQVQNVKRKYTLPEKFLLFVGTMEPRKNISGVVSAFSAIANRVSQDLVIAGEQGWKIRELMSHIASSPYSDRIHLVGFVAEEDKNALYAAADVFLYPSFYEGFGFPPLEAMVNGTPAVVSFNSSLPEVVGEWATLVDPYNTSQIAAVLEELLVSPTRVPASVQKEIREKYSWERAAKETVKILESVV